MIWRKGEDRIVVPMRVQSRARQAVRMGVTDWVDDMCREIPPDFYQASHKGNRAAMFEAVSAAETLLAILVEYQRKHYT